MKYLLFVLVLAVVQANLYQYIFNSTETTQFLTFEARSRKTSSETYYGEILLNRNNGSISFNSIGKDDKYYYTNDRMMLGDNCMTMSPIMPDNLESFFSTAERVALPSKSRTVYDPLVLQYMTGKYEIFKLDYLGLTYLIVIENKRITCVISKHLIIDFHPKNQNSITSRISQPPNLHECPISSSYYRQANNVIIHSNPTLPWYENERTCSYPWLSVEKLCPQQNEDLKECIFLHGVGNPASESGAPVSKWPYYWGDVDQYVTKHCSKITFLRLETQIRGWDNVALQKEACAGMADSDGVIRNKILYVHSMGNNILAGAIRAGRCRPDSATKWFDAHGPAKGSPTANFLEEVCENPEKSDILRYIAKVFGYCQKNNTVYPAYKTLTPSYPGLDGLSEIVDTHATGRMCGTNSFGLTSKYSAALAALSKLSMDGRVNDGMVDIDSCRTTDKTYKNDYHSPYYTSSINHADGTCRDKDGYYGVDRQPCSWYGENY